MIFLVEICAYSL